MKVEEKDEKQKIRTKKFNSQARCSLRKGVLKTEIGKNRGKELSI